MDTTLPDSLLILETIGEPYIRLDGELRFTYINPAAERGMRQSRAGLIGKTPWEVRPDCAGTALEHGLRRALAGQATVTFENYYEPWGRWYAVTAMPDSCGGLVVHVSDSTERKTLERDAVAAAERFRLTLECAEVGVWTADFVTRGFEASPIARRLHGLPEDSPLDFTAALAAVHPEDRPRVEAALERALAGATPFAAEYRALSADGAVRWLFAQARLVAGQGIKSSRLFGVVQDITARKHMEDSLRLSEERFSKAFLSNPAAMTIADLATRTYLEVNRAFEAISGYRREEVVGRQWDEIELWADKDTRNDARARLLENGSLRNLEFRFRRKNGNLGTGLISADLIVIAGRPCALTATLDVTDREQAEAARLELENQLRQSQKLESVGRLAGGVAHDFNNLLTVINGYSAALSDALRGNPLWPQVEEIRKAGERAAGLTRQLLAFSRKQIIEPRVLDLNAVLCGAEQMLRRLIGEDIELEVRLDPQPVRVVADPDQICHVLMNLAVNARDAMPDGGRLDIAVRNVEVTAAEAGAHPDAVPGRYAVIIVTDNGIGMDEKTLQNAFEPFFTTKELGKGTGLGLSTAYGIARQGGGWIDVSSQLGRGAEFRVYLPRTDASPSPPDAGPGTAAIPAGWRQGEETVLLVEDQHDVRVLAVRILSIAGYRVLEAANGAEACALAAEHAGPIHLLLTDVILPGINGKELAGRLQNARPDLKVLFMSGYTADVIGHCGVLGPEVAYLPKPFTPVELTAKVREVLVDEAAR